VFGENGLMGIVCEKEGGIKSRMVVGVLPVGCSVQLPRFCARTACTGGGVPGWRSRCVSPGAVARAAC
jgi:hypothetical protein